MRLAQAVGKLGIRVRNHSQLLRFYRLNRCG